VKRLLDIAGALAGLLVLWPVLLAVGLAVRLDSPGPALHWSRRVGRGNRIFPMPKFRTMRTDAPDVATHLLADPDQWITPLGRFLRRTSLDELPQLWSVLKGDMSLVGPHPPLQTEGERFAEWHWRTLRVTPGITCLWQINGRHEITDFDEWVRLDLEYIATRALWLDLKILLKTLPSPEGCCRSTVKFALTYGFCHEATARVSGRRESTRGLMRRDCTGASFPTSI